MPDIRIEDHCTQCGACVATCVARVFTHVDRVRAAEPAACILCGHCVAVCPVDAVAHDGFGGQAFPRIEESTLPTPDAIRTTLRARRSVREFRDRPVAREVLEQLVDIARYAPTASNRQDVEWIVITDAEVQGAISRRITHWLRILRPLTRIPLATRLTARSWGRQGIYLMASYLRSLGLVLESAESGGDPIFYHAPALFVSHSLKSNDLGVENGAYATYNLVLTAEALGLGTCLIGFLTGAAKYDAGLRRMAGVPKGHRLTTAVVVGYPTYRYRRLVARNPPQVKWIEPSAEGAARP